MNRGMHGNAWSGRWLLNIRCLHPRHCLMMQEPTYELGALPRPGGITAGGEWPSTRLCLAVDLWGRRHFGIMRASEDYLNGCSVLPGLRIRIMRLPGPHGWHIATRFRSWDSSGGINNKARSHRMRLRNPLKFAMRPPWR